MIAAIRLRHCVAALVVLAACTLASSALQAQEIFEENFDTATGSGGGVFFDGTGADEIIDYDTGLVGETAFIVTTGNTHLTAAAQGNPGGGVSGGAGEFSASNLRFNLLEQDFEDVTGLGGGVFLMGDGITPDLAGSAGSWDTGISNEDAFFATIDGAILVGDVSASGDPTGDQSGGGAGVMDVGEVNVTSGEWFGGLAFDINGFPAGSGSILLNSGFDDDFNICDGLAGWNFQGDGGFCLNVFLAATGESGQAEPESPTQDLKMFNFGGQPTNAEVYQDVDAEPGQLWRMDCFSAHVTGDTLVPGNSAEMSIEFYNDAEVMLDTITAVVLDSNSPISDPSPSTVWIDNDPIELTAPAGTTTARAVIRFISDAGGGGAAFIDTVSFATDAEIFDLSQFSLTAEIKGDIDAAGEQFGHYQLRVEDGDGDRLVFNSATVADGNWATLGGTLDTATELDSEGLPGDGVFNPGSSFLRVVVAFDNDIAPTWGGGGTLTVDNVLLTNELEAGSNYAGGLFWDDVPVSAILDPRQLLLTADIKGDEVGGTYQFRVEAFDEIPCVDEDFEGATGEGGVQLMGPDDTGGSTDDWDTGLLNEFAFAGVADGAIVTEPSGEVSVRAITSGGNPGQAGELEVHEIAPLSGSWFAGVYWDNQSLGSEDLSQVSLTADIKGTNPGFFEELGTYLLRIEDGPSGDWIGFEVMANGNWQGVGGPLSTTDASGAGDLGDGIFDIDLNRAYRVVIVFVGFDNLDGTNWNFGGTLQFDNVELTPCPNPVQVELARLGFNGEADGGFQDVGGVLSTGFTSLAPSGGTFTPGTDVDGQEIDAGIEGEFMFAGLFGGDIESVTAEGCQNCGVSNSGGARFIGQGLDDEGAGFYFLGAAWTITELTTPLDLSDVTINADLKGEWDGGTGGSPGTIVFRIEEEGNADRVAYSMQADGSFNTMGGPLDCSNTPPGQTCDPGIAFDTASPSYTLVVIIFTQDPSWGTNASITIDNLAITQGGETVFSEDFETVVGPQPGFIPEDTDFYTVTVTLENGVESWGLDGGLLTVDNIGFNEIETPPCNAFADCGDLDDNGVRDDACLFYSCESNLCSSVPRATQGDIGGGNGACPADGACDGNDRFQALNCFSDVTTQGDSGYPCEAAPPAAINVDAGSASISCELDGVCDGNDAFHALNCFSNIDSMGTPPYPCGCAGAMPDAPAPQAKTRRPGTAIALRAPATVQPGGLIDVDVYFEDPLAAVRGYQLHLGVSGGSRGGLALHDIAVDADRDSYVFSAVPGAWSRFNRETGQMVIGMDATGGVPTPANGYLATFTYRVPKDAAGTFVIDLRHDGSGNDPLARTFLFGANAAPLAVTAVTPARVTVLDTANLRKASRIARQ